MATYEAFIEVSGSNGYKFTNASNNDIVFYGTNATQQLLLGTASNNYANITMMSSNIALSVMGNTSNSAINLFTNNGANAAMTVLGTGNVGIGKTNPAYPMDVNGIVNASAIYINGSALSAAAGGGFTASASNVSYTTCNVGIGKTNPVYAIDSVGDINTSSNLRENGITLATKYALSNAPLLPLTGGTLTGSLTGTTINATTTNVSGNLTVSSNLYLSQKIGLGGLIISKNSGCNANITSTVLSIPGYTFNSNNSNIGINNGTPQYALDIIGNTNHTGNVYISSNLGIGSTSPAYKLDVTSDVRLNQITTYTQYQPYGYATTNRRYALIAQATNNAGHLRIHGIMGGDSSSTCGGKCQVDIELNARDGTINGKVSNENVSSTGVVIYRDASNNFNVYVTGGNYWKANLMIQGAPGQTTWYNPPTWSTDAAWSTPSNNTLWFDSVTHMASSCVESTFYMNTANTPVNLVTTLTSGNVGIGSTAPAYKLDVNGRINTNTTFSVTPSTYTQNLITAYNPTVSNNSSLVFVGKALTNYNGGFFNFQHLGTDGSQSNYMSIGMWGQAGTSAPINISGYGNVGIGGQNNPSYTLDVSGTQRVTGALTVGGQVSRTVAVMSKYCSTTTSIINNYCVVITFDTIYNSLGTTGITYSGGTFTNTSGSTIVVSITYTVNYGNSSSAGTRQTFLNYNCASGGANRYGCASSPGNNDYNIVSGSVIMVLNNNDYILLNAWQNSGSTLTSPAYANTIQIAVL